MAYNITTQGGSFTADGNDKTLKIRSNIDWIKVVNYTQAAATNNGYGFEYVWQRGMGTTSVMKYHPAGDHTVAVDASASSIQVIDTSSFALGANTAVTAGTNVTQPVYSTGSTAGLSNGGIVRINSTNHDNVNGLDFSVDTVVANTSFRLANTLATAPGRVAGAAGYYRTVAPNIEIYKMFTPGNRNIANITQAASAVVTTLVDHGYAVGQRVKFHIPSNAGMIQLDGLTGNITAVTDSTFTVDVDTTGFTAFAFPTYDLVPTLIPNVVPLGDNPSYASYMTAPGAFYNQGYIGVVLTGGTTYPGGNNNDVVYWEAGTYEVNNNE